jgi:hypothetical protein
MAALPAQKAAILQKLVETAPCRVVASLQQALADTSDESALGCVRRLVDAEIADRRFRGDVLSPVAPMFVGSGNNRNTLTFPNRSLSLIWRGLKTDQAAAVAEAHAAWSSAEKVRGWDDCCDRLASAAAFGLRARENADFRAAAQLCDQARSDGAIALVNCLEISTVVRRATGKLPIWIAHAGSDTSAASRLAYNDAVEIAEDAGPRFFEMLAAQLDQPWMVLRIISAVMERPTERYMADTELAGFVVKVMDEVEVTLTAIDNLDYDGGTGVGRSLASETERAVNQIAEIETNFELNRKRGWGARAQKQRQRLATLVESQFRAAEKATLDVLPMHTTQLHGIQRTVPLLDSPPDPLLVNRATTLLSFMEAARTAANYGGFSTARSKLIEKLGEFLANYVEDVLGLVRSGEAGDLGNAGAFLEVLADFSEQVTGEKAGELVRRRAHAALSARPAAVGQI